MEKFAFKKVDLERTKNLSKYPMLLRELLVLRGINNEVAAKNFLNPDYDKDTHDPHLLKDMQKTVERIIFAVKNNERIVIYSDYDADGIPGAVILHDFFKKIGYENFENYIPDRHEEGFGLNVAAIEELSDRGAKLIITVDCGIADVEPVQRANELKIDIVITDHHEPNGIIPKAYAILNPKQPDCSYPEKMLCGAAVAFKLIQALLKQKKEFKTSDESIKEGWEKWLLDMVGIATLSDMVPLRGENRVLARYGLKVLRLSPRLGLLSLFDRVKVSQRHLSEDDISFLISPRINAASRMGVPIDAFRLLVTEDKAEAYELSRHLNEINDQRKGIVAMIVKEAKKTILAKQKTEVIAIGNPNWKPALLGLVANTLQQEFSCPVFLWGRADGLHIKGSCRSNGVANVMEIMETAKETFSAFGGHEFSGGFTILHEKVHTFEQAITEAYKKVSKENLPEEQVLIDKVLFLDDINWQNYRIIEELSPYGVGNPKPVFMFQGIKPIVVKKFGREKKHLEVKFENKNGPVSSVAFFASENDFSKIPVAGEVANLIATMEKSVFLGTAELRLRIIDFV